MYSLSRLKFFIHWLRWNLVLSVCIEDNTQDGKGEVTWMRDTNEVTEPGKALGTNRPVIKFHNAISANILHTNAVHSGSNSFMLWSLVGAGAEWNVLGSKGWPEEKINLALVTFRAASWRNITVNVMMFVHIFRDTQNVIKRMNTFYLFKCRVWWTPCR